MATTVEELEQRVARLEHELARLGQVPQSLPGQASEPKRTSLLAQARRDKPRLRAIAAKAFAEMGIPETPPVPAEQLRDRMEADGIRPEENLFSRGVLEMRKE